MHNKPSHLENLNPEQLRAVRHGDGPLLIFAGAGSGKTRVLTRRIANLIIEHQVPPERILAVTFTNKAAEEMKHRVGQLWPEERRSVFVSTFHSCCASMLRKHAHKLDYTRQFAIYDKDNSLALIKRICKRLGNEAKALSPQSILTQIDRAKNDYRFADDLRTDSLSTSPLNDLVAEVFDNYQQELHAANAMDFGDLLCNVLTLFTLDAEILNYYQEHYCHVLIDEYQDTNRVQYKLTHMLTSRRQNLCVVGDDDQSIYGFRGATVRNILNFKHDFPEAEIITLHRNYRSTGNIIKAAAAIIAKNEHRQKKKMSTANPEGSPVYLYSAKTEKDEARFVSSQIAALREEGITLSSIAVFYRTNAQSRVIEEALCERQLTYRIFGGYRFYDRKEIRDILGYLRLLNNPRDNEAFLRVVNTPARGLGAVSIQQLIRRARNESLTLFEMAKKVVTSGPNFLGAAQKRNLERFVDLIDQLKIDLNNTKQQLCNPHGTTNGEAYSHALVDLIRSIVDRTGYLKHIASLDQLEAEARTENIDELSVVVFDFARAKYLDGQIPTVDDFLARANLSSDLDKENSSSSSSSDAVSLMTLHLAKGLEFDIVFLIGLDEGILPHLRSMNHLGDLEEERRLCYVGITRAKKQLYLSRAAERMTFSAPNPYLGTASRFLSELPENGIRAVTDSELPRFDQAAPQN